jgi:hypothetical protein
LGAGAFFLSFEVVVSAMEGGRYQTRAPIAIPNLPA